MTTQVGGSFAPPLSDEALRQYRVMIDALPATSRIRAAMDELHKCCAAWWELPESEGDGKPHASGRGTIVNLTADNAKALWELIPWPDELDAMARVLDSLDPVKQRGLRNAAFHLLWHVRELDLDREPMTTDKL